MTLDLSSNKISIEGAQYIGNALQTNTVREILFSFYCCCLAQCLKTLNLLSNKIIDGGVGYVATALQSNMVRNVYKSSIKCLLLSINTDTYKT
jgi:hypothetical protein